MLEGHSRFEANLWNSQIWVKDMLGFIAEEWKHLLYFGSRAGLELRVYQAMLSCDYSISILSPQAANEET